jgi:hypothetical protein
MDAGSMTTPGQVPAPDNPGALVPAPTFRSPGSWRTAVVLGAVLILGVGLALVIVATATRPVAEYRPGTPEQAFQAYLAAWEAHDVDGAYALFSDRVKARLPIEEYREMARGWGYGGEVERRVVLSESTLRGDHATLKLRIDEWSGGGLFGGDNVWSHTIAVGLVREAGAWHLDQAMADLEPIWYEK